MATYKKLQGTTDNLFVVDAAGNVAGVALKHEAGVSTPSSIGARNQGDSTYVPLRVLNDAADPNSCMTRGAISALAGSTDGVKWFKVDFVHNGGGVGNYDFPSATQFPDDSYIVDCRVNVTTAYDTAPNTIKIGWVAAGDTSISNGTGVDLATGPAIYELPQIKQATTGAPMNIHVQVNESGVTTVGAGEVWVGYIETPAT
jgi:hypothetical protein